MSRILSYQEHQHLNNEFMKTTMNLIANVFKPKVISPRYIRGYMVMTTSVITGEPIEIFQSKIDLTNNQLSRYVIWDNMKGVELELNIRPQYDFFHEFIIDYEIQLKILLTEEHMYVELLNEYVNRKWYKFWKS